MFDRKLDSGVRLVDLVMGIFVAGGSQGTMDQLKIYAVGKARRDADEIVPTRDVKGRDYLVNRSVPAQHYRWPARQGKIF